MQRLKHFIEAQQLTPEHIELLCARADQLRKRPSQKLKGKILASLFYEPSTRTRFSFESAMLRLGGNTLATENASEFSSAIKGENLRDTIKMAQEYADVIVIRHKVEGSAALAASVSRVPVINAGDGKGQHPSQALLDMYTIQREMGRVSELRVGIAGDLAHGRTARSLAYLLSKFPQEELIFIAPRELAIGNDIKAHLHEKRTPFREAEDLEKELADLDILYMTRIQKERMDIEKYERIKKCFVIGEKQLEKMRREARIMHPLPKVDEINLPTNIEDQDPRVAYFRQAGNGLYVRMALLEHLAGK